MKIICALSFVNHFVVSDPLWNGRSDCLWYDCEWKRVQCYFLQLLATLSNHRCVHVTFIHTCSWMQKGDRWGEVVQYCQMYRRWTCTVKPGPRRQNGTILFWHAVMYSYKWDSFTHPNSSCPLHCSRHLGCNYYPYLALVRVRHERCLEGDWVEARAGVNQSIHCTFSCTY